MATSFQAFPPPGAVYPTGETNEPATSYHSNGSYGTVFVVLAVIVVVSAIACVLGRFCSKRSSDQPKSKSKSKNKHQNSHIKAPSFNGRSKDRDIELGFGPKGGDIEIGFDKKIPKMKVAPNGHGPHGHGKQGQRPPPPSSHGRDQFVGHPMGHRQLPMMECPRNFQ